MSAKESIDDVLLDVAWKNYSSSSEEKQTLDEKASVVLAADGILLGLIINGFNALDPYLAFIAIGFALISSFFCLKALSLRQYNVLGAQLTWSELNKNGLLNDLNVAKQAIWSTIEKASNNNREQTKKIADCINLANISFIISLVTIVLALAFKFYHTNPL